MSDQGEQTPEREAAAERIAHEDRVSAVLDEIGDLMVYGPQGGPHLDWPRCAEILGAALRSAEARGRVQGLREAALDILTEADSHGADYRAWAMGWLNARADAIEQEQPK